MRWILCKLILRVFDPKRVKCAASEWPATYLPSGESCPWSLVRSSRQVFRHCYTQLGPRHQLENISRRFDTMTVVRSVLVILFGVFVATTAR